MAISILPNSDHDLDLDFDLTHALAEQLSHCLRVDVLRVQAVAEAAWRPGAVFKVMALDGNQNEHSLVLKRQDNEVAYALYLHYLKPYQLNSPQHYGYVVLNQQRFLVMDFVRHGPEDWANGLDYLRAVRWLIKKDRISGQHLETLRSLDCLAQWRYYGLEDWLPEFERWHKTSTSPQSELANVVWQQVRTNQDKINDTIAALDIEGTQTVVHGDVTLGNVLFAEGESADEGVVVIDWMQPHISSVTKDLASLYDNAPLPYKSEVLRVYREAIDFPRFEQTFAKAMLLRDIGYLAWMVGMINDGEQDDITPSEVDRVARSLLAALDKGF